MSDAEGRKVTCCAAHRRTDDKDDDGDDQWALTKFGRKRNGKKGQGGQWIRMGLRMEEDDGLWLLMRSASPSTQFFVFTAIFDA